MSDANMPFAEWLSSTRKAKKFSQQRLADETGIDRGHLSKIENGRIGMPNHDTRQRIHQVLGTSDDDLADLGILEKLTFKKRSGEGTVTIYRVPEQPDDASHATIGEVDTDYDAPLPAHLRTSFLKLEAMTPERRQRLIDLIEDQAALDEIERARLRRDDDS